MLLIEGVEADLSGHFGGVTAGGFYVERIVRDRENRRRTAR
jgi:hypothetical protein